MVKTVYKCLYLIQDQVLLKVIKFSRRRRRKRRLRRNLRLRKERFTQSRIFDRKR